ncbi:MAG: proline--tRNA ligase [Pseudomonadota bacterium]
MSDKKTAISPTRSENYSEWYQQVIRAAELAESAPIHGCMIIKPWGYALWENIQSNLDKKIKETNHENIYCPLFIPISYFEKEAQHISGFAKECAVVTHHRLEVNEEGKLIPAAPLEEPLIVRPTSETTMGEAFARWIHSYRDLPLLINQWANIVRWEMRPRLFLRTTEFLWQEGHTAHETEQDALEETLRMLDVYEHFAQDYLAMPVIKGMKTENEKFPGAVSTYCIEAMMQDGKALQAGTSHLLGQNFSKAFNIQFLNAKGEKEHVWTTSWGVSTRLIGGLIMTHSDDDGLIVPPRIAPLHAVILPVTHQHKASEAIHAYCEALANEMRSLTYHGQPIRVKVDTKDKNPGEKAWYWRKKGVPLRIEIGPREYEAKNVFLKQRDQANNQTQNLSKEEFLNSLPSLLDTIQKTLFERAKQFQKEHSKFIRSANEFYDYFKNQQGFAYTYWAGDGALEDQLKKEYGITIRCLPLSESENKGQCIFTGKPNAKVAIFAKAY